LRNQLKGIFNSIHLPLEIYMSNGTPGA